MSIELASQTVLESQDVLSIVHKYIEPEAAVAVARVSRDVGAPAAAVQRMGSCASMKMPGSWVSCT